VRRYSSLHDEDHFRSHFLPNEPHFPGRRPGSGKARQPPRPIGRDVPNDSLMFAYVRICSLNGKKEGTGGKAEVRRLNAECWNLKPGRQRPLFLRLIAPICAYFLMAKFEGFCAGATISFSSRCSVSRGGFLSAGRDATAFRQARTPAAAVKNFCQTNPIQIGGLLRGSGSFARRPRRMTQNRNERCMGVMNWWNIAMAGCHRSPHQHSPTPFPPDSLRRHSAWSAGEVCSGSWVLFPSQVGGYVL
jgi:hypothetical protein